MSCCSKKACAITSLVIGTIVIVLGGVLMFVYDILFEKILIQVTKRVKKRVNNYLDKKFSVLHLFV